jgi:hypothetical protein
MNLHRFPRLLPTLVVASGLILAGAAAAAPAKAHHHHDGKGQLGDGINHEGHHDIDHKGKYTASVEVHNKKIHAFHVVHATKGNIPVKKYKTHKKLAQSATAHITYASFQDQMADMGTVYIGYSYIDDDGNEETYWYPEEMIEDLDTGAVEYVAES